MKKSHDYIIDKDFIQLQKYDNVKQYSPITKKLVDECRP